MGDYRASRVERAKAGDGRAFEELLGPVLGPGFRLAMTMLNDRGAAEDAVQEAATVVFGHCGQRVPDDPPRALADSASGPRDPGAASPRRRLGRPLRPRCALGRLGKHHLLALSLYYHLDLPIDEVARVFNCSEGAARQRIHRALEALRPRLVVEAES